MSFASFVNIITIIFCLAVLVQSVRMMRSLEAVKGAGAALPQMLQGLDAATAQASKVLGALNETLHTDAAVSARMLSQAEDIRDELGIMVGIANATADRLLEASSQRNAENDRNDDSDDEPVALEEALV
jgi:hypothetical protein